MSIIEIENLEKTYYVNSVTVNALRGISLKVEEGEFISIVGPSGSGKSTLMHIIGGIDSPTKGKVVVGGNDLCKLSKDEMTLFRRRNIGLIYQFYNLVSVLNVEENIVLPSRLSGEKIDSEKLNLILDSLGLSDRRGHYPSELSGGQQQRVAIARTIYSNPPIILADEPTGNLDSVNSREVISEIINLNKKYKKTVIMITHDMDIAAHADRVLRICDGNILEQ